MIYFSGRVFMNYRIIVVLICCLVLSSCNRVTDAVFPELSEPTTTTVASDISVQPQKNNDSTLRLAIPLPNNLDPLLNTDVRVDRLLRLVFEPLFVLDDSFKAVPNLATGYSVGDGGMSVTVTIPSGLTWEDGLPITASDIEYSIDKLRNAPNNVIYKSCVENVSYCAPLSDTECIIRYKSPIGAVGCNLCFPIEARHYYEGSYNAPMKPMGNGSFRFTGYTQSKEATFVASSSFKGAPKIQKVIATVIPDDVSELDALEHGITDVAVVSSSETGKIRAAESESAVLYNTNKFTYLGFNLRNETLADISVRSALARLIPTDEIIRNIYAGRAVASITPINPINGLLSDVGVESYQYDESMAASVLQAAGVTNNDNFSLTILVNNENSGRIKIAEKIKTSFNKVGLSASVEALPYNEYLKRLSSGDFDIYIAQTELKENYNLYSLLHSKAINGGINYMHFSDAYMDRIIAECNTASDETQYKEKLNELNKYCSIALPVAGICFEREALVTTEHIQGDKKPTLNNIFANINQWEAK